MEAFTENRLRRQEPQKKGGHDFRDIGTHQVADTFKRLELSEPNDLAAAVAANDKNFFGSVVSVEEGDGWVEIRREKCALKEGINAFVHLDAGLMAKQQCKTYVESHRRKVFADLGIKLEVEETDECCAMKTSRIWASTQQIILSFIGRKI